MATIAKETITLKTEDEITSNRAIKLKTGNMETQETDSDRLLVSATRRPWKEECNQDKDLKTSDERMIDRCADEIEEKVPQDMDPEQAYAEGKISKKQLKRLRRDEAWRKKKAFLKTKRKEQRRLEAQKRREKGEPNKKRLRLEFEKRLETSDITITMDLSFDDLMMEQDIKKLMKQIERCYAVNKRAPVPVQMHLSSLGGRCKQRMETAIAGWQGWKVGMEREMYTEVFERERIVYLTSDSPNILTTLEAGKVYVIGGLVDHNSHKGLCYQKACEAGVAHAQLPIGQFVRIQSRKVLAVNHVFEIMLAYLELHDWQEAFLRVIPQRKGVEALSPDQAEEATRETETAVGDQTSDQDGLLDVITETAVGDQTSDQGGLLDVTTETETAAGDHVSEEGCSPSLDREL